MARDRNERGFSKSQRSDMMTGARIWLPLDMLQGAAYASLSFSASTLLVELAAQLRGKGGIKNNGDLTTAYTVLSKRGWKDEKTIRKAANELESVGLIVKTRQGHLPNTCNLYAVTWLPLNEMDKLDITAKGFPLYAYKLQDKVPAIKLKPNRENFRISENDSSKNSLSKRSNFKSDKEKIPLSDTLNRS